MGSGLMAGLERASGRAKKLRRSTAHKPDKKHPWKVYQPGFFARSPDKVYITGKQRGSYGKRVPVLVDRVRKTEG